VKASCTSILDIDSKTADAAQKRARFLEILSRRLLVPSRFRSGERHPQTLFVASPDHLDDPGHFDDRWWHRLLSLAHASLEWTVVGKTGCVMTNG
jgi:hypothetical protein